MQNPKGNELIVAVLVKTEDRRNHATKQKASSSFYFNLLMVNLFYYLQLARKLLNSVNNFRG